MSKTSLTARLARAGLRPTAKRLQLAHVLFDGGDKHFTAEQAHEMATKAGMRMSQATVYNTLNQFAAAGLLNRIALDSKRTFFDTNTGDHHHIFYDDDGELVDVPLDQVQVVGTPALKPGESLRRVDVILRVARQHP
jgi:Fur family iron response transcriptional regulator